MIPFLVAMLFGTAFLTGHILGEQLAVKLGLDKPEAPE